MFKFQQARHMALTSQTAHYFPNSWFQQHEHARVRKLLFTQLVRQRQDTSASMYKCPTTSTPQKHAPTTNNLYINLYRSIQHASFSLLQTKHQHV